MDSGTKAEALTDGQIVMVLDLANTGEIDQAKLAQTKAKNARVKKFATMMVTQHTDAKRKQEKLVTKQNLRREESTKSSQLTSESSNMLTTLKNTAATDFDREYISSQVDMHAALLHSIDTELLPNIKDTELKNFVQELRPTVSAHLEEARDIQQSLSSGSSSGTGSTSSGAHSGSGTHSSATTTGSKSTTGTGTGTNKGANSGSSSGSNSGSGNSGSSNSGSTSGGSSK